MDSKINLTHGVLLIAVISLLGVTCEAAIPLQINHQGFIDVGGTAFNGNGVFRFALVDPDSGNNVWTNDASGIGTSATPTAAVSLPVINGIYNVRLGDTTLPNMTALSSPLFNDDNLELRVWFDDGANGLEVLSPDQPLTSAPYAFHAAFSDDADTVDGAHAATLEESAEIDADVITHDTDTGAHANIQLDGSNIATGTIANARLNTGPGNGLDADTVDGSQAAALEESAEIDSDVSTHNTDTGAHSNIQLDGLNIATGTIDNARLNMGSGNGLDADTLDGFEASDLLNGPTLTLFNSFGGDGSDGSITVSSPTNFSTLSGGANNYYLQTTSFTVSPGQTLTIDTGRAFIGVQGTCTINGIIDGDGEGSSGGAVTANAGYAGQNSMGLPPSNTESRVDNYSIAPALVCLSGSGGGGGGTPGGIRTGGLGGGAAGRGGRGGLASIGQTDGENGQSPTWSLLDIKGPNSEFLFVGLHPGAGGGSGALDGTNGGIGGNGGGVIYIECDALNFTGTLTCDGDIGTNGTAGASAGAGGGGGGGVVIIRANTITQNVGTVTVTGGAGGTGAGTDGGDGGDGAAGYSAIVDLN